MTRAPSNVVTLTNSIRFLHFSSHKIPCGFLQTIARDDADTFDDLYPDSSLEVEGSD